MNGILLVNKPINYTSRDIVNIVGKKLKTKKVGHTGTLDPMATGVLVLCIGEATKLNELLTSTYKEYEAEITLGLLTDTLDTTGNVIKKEIISYSEEQIINALNKIKGKYIQKVPIYSAVKVNGKKLYEYAREGRIVDLPKREVDIKEIELISDIQNVNDTTVFKIRCLVSKGTYIRSLVNDIANLLNTVGVMSKLERTKQGKYNIEDCYTLKDIEEENYKLISISNALSDYKKITVNKELEFKIKNGAIIDKDWSEEKILFIDSDNNLLALYKNYENGKNKMKPWKMFTNK